jgi:hypothetical protein
VEALDTGAALAGGATESAATGATDGAASAEGDTELAEGEGGVVLEVGSRSTVERHAAASAKAAAMFMIFMVFPR